MLNKIIGQLIGSLEHWTIDELEKLILEIKKLKGKKDEKVSK